MTDAATIDNAQQPQGEGSEDAQSAEPQKPGRSPHGERRLKSVSAAFRPPRGCRSLCLCPVFPAHAGWIPHVRDCW